jgi:hypothetical protein
VPARSETENEPQRSPEEPEEPVPPGFGQGRDEEPRIPRFRIELAFQPVFFQARGRDGKNHESTTIDFHDDFRMPQFALGTRATFVLKVHRYLAFGLEWHHFAADSPTVTLKHRVGWGVASLAAGQNASASVEIQQADFDVRIVAADDERFRAEFFFGVGVLSYRSAVHPRAPYLLAFPGDSSARAQGSSNGFQETLVPALGLFFCWNLDPRVAVFFENRSGYISPMRFGSIGSWVRAGFRIHIGDGLELMLGGFWNSGQIYPIRDAPFFKERGPAHRFEKASWYSGGPEFGISFTY